MGGKKAVGKRGYALNAEKTKNPERVLVTGSLGQIGAELTLMLSQRGHKVLATDVRPPPAELAHKFGSAIGFRYLDVSSDSDIRKLVVENRITSIIHLSAKLSATAERDPGNSFGVNTRGVENVLEIGRQYGLKVYAPSSIAAFGPATPNLDTLVADVTIQRPLNVYGVAKLYLEVLGEWYHHRYALDFRSLRYPGILSSDTLPGGGTTDYAIEIFYAALIDGYQGASFSPTSRSFTCGVGPNRRLPMMYMPDCLKATVDIFEAESSDLKLRTYNVAAMSFTPDEIVSALNRAIKTENHSLPIKAKPLEMNYKLDIRDQIASTWPAALDDTNARNDWKWSHTYDLDALARDMLHKISNRLVNNPVL
jgi:threonine 3-dehydrogenase